MDDAQLQQFLRLVGCDSLVEYVDPVGETVIEALNRRLKWAERYADDPRKREEAQFLLNHATELQQLAKDADNQWDDDGDPWAATEVARGPSETVKTYGMSGGNVTRMDDIGDVAIPEGPAKVVANLPYNVGTQLVIRLVDRPDKVSSIVVMLQKEVVQRLVAEPGSKAYGSLTVQIAARGQARWLLGVPPDSFFPPPKVDSAVVRIDLYDEAQTGGLPKEDFDRLVRASFRQRRKTLVNSLGAEVGKARVQQALASLELDSRVRAEALSHGHFVSLAQHILAGSAE